LAGGAFRPCAVRTGDRGQTPLQSWRYDRETEVLTLRVFGRNMRVDVRACRE
jgi:hypothetical protein